MHQHTKAAIRGAFLKSKMKFTGMHKPLHHDKEAILFLFFLKIIFWLYLTVLRQRLEMGTREGNQTQDVTVMKALQGGHPWEGIQIHCQLYVSLDLPNLLPHTELLNILKLRVLLMKMILFYSLHYLQD